MKRGWSTAATMPALTPATSVTTPPPASARVAAGAVAPAGVAMNVSPASGSGPTSSTAPRSSARLARASSRSMPETCHPWPRRARPIEAPMRPVPTTHALLGEVIAQTPGPLEVDVVQLGPTPFGGHVHQDPHATTGAVNDFEFSGTDQRNVTETDPACRGGRKHRPDVVGGGEQDADEIILAQSVALQHGVYECLDALVDLLDVVVVERGGPTNGSYGSRHGLAA